MYSAGKWAIAPHAVVLPFLLWLALPETLACHGRGCVQVDWSVRPRGTHPPGSGVSVWNPPLNAGAPRNDPKAFDRTLSDRCGEHLHSVEGFKENPRYQGDGFHVAEHFNLPEHNHVHDMRVSVVRQAKGGTATRQREERWLIFQLGTLAPEGLNIDFNFL